MAGPLGGQSFRSRQNAERSQSPWLYLVSNSSCHREAYDHAEAHVKKRNWPKELREHADAMERAAQCILDFRGENAEDHALNLQDAAEDFRSDADKYEQTQ